MQKNHMQRLQCENSESSLCRTCQSGSREELAADRVRGRAESPLGGGQATLASGPRMGEGSKTQRRAEGVELFTCFT